VDDLVALSKARSMLIVLLASSEQALAALAPIDHHPGLDTQLHALIDRTKAQLEAFANSAD
jgi:hypothetical protein